RRARPHVVPPLAILPAQEPISEAPLVLEAMAERTFREFSVPSTDNVATGPNINVRGMNFELKSSLINMVQASPFCGKPNEDANAHLQNFLELCDTVVIRGVAADVVKLRLFPFSFLGKAKQWFNKEKDIDTWDKYSKAFLAKFFPLAKTNALRRRISSFQQTGMESIPEAWERLQEYILACPHHGMDELLVLQSFYNGLTTTSRANIDAAAGGAFLDLTIAKSKALVEKMISNQGWSDERLQPCTKGMHTVKEMDMIAAK